MSELKKVICYGAGGLGKMAAAEMPERGCEIVCFCDSDKNKWGTKFEGYDVIPPETLAESYKDTPVAIASMYVPEITEFLNSLGIFDIFPFKLRYGNYGKRLLNMEKKHKNEDALFLGKNGLSRLCADLFGNSGKRIFIESTAGLESYDGKTPLIICTPNYLDVARELLGKGFLNTINGLYYLFYKKKYDVFKNFIDNILFSDKSYTNQGEFGNDDLILEALFNALDTPLPKYADIGCNLPTDGNNTYIFYEKGAQGQLVEPNPRLSERLALARPRDTLLSVGIGCENEEKATFFINNVFSGLSTFNSGNSNFWETRLNRKMYEKVEVDLVKFNDTIERDVQLVSIDAEGLDFEILKTVDFNLYKDLAVVCAEVFDADEYMHQQGFKLFLKNYTNSIFVKKDLFEKILADKLCAEIYYGYACIALIKETIMTGGF